MKIPVYAGAQPLYRASGLLLAAGLLLSACSLSESQPSATPQPTESQAQSMENPAASSSPDAPEFDTTIVPGDRVGAVTATTTYDDLVALYGADRLESVEVYLGEGMFAPGTRVTQGAQSFSVVWTDESRTAVQSVRDFGVAWQVDPGIGVGTSLSELRDKLGEFELYGFGWDYGGTMVLDETVLEPYKENLILRLGATVETGGRIGQYESVMGERSFPSDTPAFQDMELAVREMIVRLN